VTRPRRCSASLYATAAHPADTACMFATSLLADTLLRILFAYELELLRGATLAQLISALDTWPTAYAAAAKA
jgi:hypothetical protein